MFCRYDDLGNQIRTAVRLSCEGDEIRVEQSHKDEVDVNVIVKKHGMELISQVAALQQFTYDTIDGNDFQESMNALLRAKETFSLVPSDIRKEFDNDPAKFMDFVYNPANKEKLVSMGLAVAPEPAPAPVKVQVVNEEPLAPVTPGTPPA